MNTPIYKRVPRTAKTGYVARNGVVRYLCPGTVVLPKSIVDAVKRGLKSKPLKNTTAFTKAAKPGKHSCMAEMIVLHKGEILLPPRYGDILARVMNTH